MKNIFIALSIFIASITFLSGCKKDDAKSRTQLITQKEWKVLSWVVGTTDLTAVDACDKDDETIFRADSTYEKNEGATQCDPTDPYIYETSTWHFLQNETVLEIDGGQYYITTLNETTLRLSFTQGGQQGTLVYYR